MTIFSCENSILESDLIALRNLVVENGGYLNDNIIFVEKGGELNVTSSLGIDNHEKLITLTEACLPRVNDFMITCHKGRLIAEPKSPHVRESHVAILRTMFELFNAANKINTHRDTNPWLALKRSPALIHKLCEVRPVNYKIQKYYEKYRAGKFDELLVDTFIGSRSLDLELNGNEKPVACMMPFIDFVNHNCMGSKFQVSNDGKLSILNFKLNPAIDECFAHYGMLDAFDSFMTFGFVDINAPFVRSAPFQFDIPEMGNIHIDTSIREIRQGDLPDSVKDLRMYIPFVSELDDDVIKLSHFFVPGASTPRALRRLLVFYILAWKPELDMDTVNDIVVSVEESIIQTNLEYYMELSSVVDSVDRSVVPPVIMKSVETLIKHQMKNLQQYNERIKNINN